MGYGTALGVLRAATEKGKRIKVFATESRPVLQGARLTAFELANDGFDVTLLPDTAVGLAMQRGLIDGVIVGADRITKDGHVFNKVGTYQIATLAKKHHLPFYVAAPVSSFDFVTSWKKVKIEERSADEVRRIAEKQLAPDDILVFNPAFDITPPNLITAIVCEAGILRKPYARNIAKMRASLKPR